MATFPSLQAFSKHIQVSLFKLQGDTLALDSLGIDGIKNRLSIGVQDISLPQCNAPLPALTPDLTHPPEFGRGSVADCSATPAQIPACGFSAPGSSEILAPVFSLLDFSAIACSEVSIRSRPYIVRICVSVTSCVSLPAPFPCKRLSRS
jgi:hypothetical protein